MTTLEENALGCTQKAGNAHVKGVLAYGEKITIAGLNLLSAPGNDLVASTALAASGCQMVLFSTGRGTPFACPVPTMKLSTNTPLATFKDNWIDFDCGGIVRDKTLADMGKALLEEVIQVADGKEVKSEAAGRSDLAIFKKGVTL